MKNLLELMLAPFVIVAAWLLFTEEEMDTYTD